MSAPTCVLNLPLRHGGKVSDLVADDPPTVVPVGSASLEGFRNVWNERLNDAIRTANQDTVAPAQAVLELVEGCEDAQLFMWAKHKLTVVYVPALQAALVTASPEG